jgi:hypothetical protein
MKSFFNFISSFLEEISRAKEATVLARLGKYEAALSFYKS